MFGQSCYTNDVQVLIQVVVSFPDNRLKVTGDSITPIVVKHKHQGHFGREFPVYTISAIKTYLHIVASFCIRDFHHINYCSRVA